MKKVFLLITFILLLPLNTLALEYPSLHYDSAIVYDLTDNKVLYELNSTEQKSIASLTKLMTIITAIENTEDLNKTITYDSNMKNNIAWYASVAGFKVGDKLTFNDLLYAAMLPSGADATVAVHIRHLREKIEINPNQPRYIKVVWGQGYKIDDGVR